MKMVRVLCTSLVLLLFVAGVARACVGKTVVIGSKGSVQQDVLAQVLAVLITERTGTTVKVVRFDSTAAAHQALLSAEIDMYVEYTGIAQRETLKETPGPDVAASYGAVKDAYNRDLNLIWLEPLGFSLDGELPAQAAPVVRKDTLKKFPALARLINKLGGKIDAAAIADMEEQAVKQSLPEVARSFLKSQRLI
ncbi:MAG: hypothetical protein C0624_09930 [Desulfuromonas sp.]|nr:MAG: hypothetical protein C0624_09930 [Desulfuromonas sp.]